MPPLSPKHFEKQRVFEPLHNEQCYRPLYDTLLLAEEVTGRPICALQIRPKNAGAAAEASPFAALRALSIAGGGGSDGSGSASDSSTARFQALMSLDR